VPPALILTAVELEARVLARELELRALAAGPSPVFARGAVRLAVVGVGAAMLGQRWPSLLDGLERPLVISAGLCGGLDPRLVPGDLVVPESVAGPAGELYNVTPSRHRAAVAAAPSASTALLVTTREVVATPAAKAALFARTGAAAADLESSLILHAAAASGLPSLVVRGVSDGAREGLPPELLRLVTPEGKMRLAGAIALVARPAILPRALDLHRATRRALRAVARLLAALTA